MKCTALFYNLTQAQTDEINSKGWGCQVGHAYMGVYAGNYLPALRENLFEKTATLDVTELEDVFETLQNLTENGWRSLATVTRHTENTRSMMTGDVIYVHETKQFHKVAGVGFEVLSDPEVVAEFTNIMEKE